MVLLGQFTSLGLPAARSFCCWQTRIYAALQGWLKTTIPWYQPIAHQSTWMRDIKLCY
jgi:hypothetical protein